MDRFAFVLRRPLQLVPVLIGISLVTFVLVQLMPGDPVRIMLGPRASADAIAAVRARYGLDQPILLQYGYYLSECPARATSASRWRSAPRCSMSSSPALVPTVCLLFYGLVMSVAFTVALAVAAARRPGRLDRSDGAPVLRRGSGAAVLLARPHADHAVQPAAEAVPGLRLRRVRRPTCSGTCSCRR